MEKSTIKSASAGRRIWIAPLAALLLLAFAGTADAAGTFPFNFKHGETFQAKLTGDQEVPPVETDTIGRFQIRFNKDKTRAEYELVVLDGVEVRRAHLHCNFAGANGPIVVFLTGDRPANDGIDVDGKWIDNATIMDENIGNVACGANLDELAEAMKEGKVYVNVHTIASPGGEIRGQLEKRRFFPGRFGHR